MNEQDMGHERPTTTWDEFASWNVAALENRKAAADLSFEVAQAERARTLLRFEIAKELAGEGGSKTASMDRARIDARYIKASENVDELTRRWEHRYAEALANDTAISLALAVKADQRAVDRTKVVLRSVQAFIDQHVRTLAEE